MSKFCVMVFDDVPEEFRDDYLKGLEDTAKWARHEPDDSIAEEADLARDLVQNPATSESTFWQYQGALTACANALKECPHCHRRSGPCGAAGKAA